MRAESDITRRSSTDTQYRGPSPVALHRVPVKQHISLQRALEISASHKFFMQIEDSASRYQKKAQGTILCTYCHFSTGWLATANDARPA